MIHTLLICLKSVFILFSVDFIEYGYNQNQGQAGGGGVMTPKKVTTIGLDLTTSSILMSVDNVVDESVLKRAPVEAPKPFSWPYADTSSYSISTPRNAWKYALSPGSALPDVLTSFSKTHKKTQSMQDVVNNMRSDSAASSSDVSTSDLFSADFSSSS